MSNNQVLMTTTGDIETFNKLIVGNSVSSMRQAKTTLQIILLNLNQTLIELRTNEAVVKGRIYNNLQQAEIETRYKAGQGTQVNPQQSLDPQIIGPPTSQGINSTIFKVTTSQYGVQQLSAELARIDYDIQNVLSQIRTCEDKIAIIENALEPVSQKSEQQKFVEKSTGKAVPPETTDLEVDKIQKSVYANIAPLLQLAQAYSNYTTDYQDKKGKFPDDKDLPTKLIIIRQAFWSQVQQFPKYLSGESILDVSNPGSENNLIILKMDLNNVRNVGKSEKISPQVAKSVKDLISITNDGTVSKGIERKPHPVLSSDNSMNAQTKTYSMTALRLGPLYIGTWELPSLGDAIKKLVKKDNEALFKGLPICFNVTPINETSTDVKEVAQDAVTKALQDYGAKAFQDALAKASITRVIVDLPNDAPEWVQRWVNLYADGSVGEVVASYTTTSTLNATYYVVHTYNNLYEEAQKSAKSIASNTLNFEGLSNYGDPTHEYSYLSGSLNIYYGAWALSPDDLAGSSDQYPIYKKK